MSEEKQMQKKSKLPLVIVLAVVVATVIVVAVLAVRSNSPERRLQEQLALGERYLTEMDYEQAIAVYQAAIEIDPRSADAYLGLAEAYVGMGDYEAAERVLENGYEQTGDERLAQRRKELEGILENAESAAGEAEENAGSEDSAPASDAPEITDSVQTGNSQEPVQEEDETVLEELAITDFAYTSDANGKITVSGGFHSDGTAEIRIAAWKPEEWSHEDIVDAYRMYGEIWENDEVTETGSSFAESFPADGKDPGKYYVLLLGRNEEREIVSYSVVEVMIGQPEEEENAAATEGQITASVLEWGCNVNPAVKQYMSGLGYEWTDMNPYMGSGNGSWAKHETGYLVMTDGGYHWMSYNDERGLDYDFEERSQHEALMFTVSPGYWYAVYSGDDSQIREALKVHTEMYDSFEKFLLDENMEWPNQEFEKQYADFCNAMDKIFK